VHAPAPEAVAGKLDWKKASSAIAAVGFRPCTGALIVLVFALSQGIYAAGILATFAMGLGTGLTVAVLTLLAVSVRAVAIRAAASNPEARWTAHLHTAFEGVAAVVILLFGALMLGASLYGV
jgi:nickel/cobalt transporter (NicO) family protein